MRIAIAGAGIGGLATALSLHAAGFDDITVFERSTQIRGLGVGINLLPHAVRELTELGLDARIAELGVPPTALTYFNRYGQRIWSESRGRAAGYRWPQLSVHRGRLQLMLRDAVVERLGDVIRLDHRLEGVTEGRAGLVAHFSTSTRQVNAEADVLIGADGIHSALRNFRYPEEGDPVWGGLTLWRGTALAPAFLDGATMVMVGDGEQKFVSYPLEAPRPDGRQRLNFIAEVRGSGSRDADWNRSVDIGPVAELFDDWKFDWLDVPAIISAADEVLEYPMVDRNAIPRWSFGRTTLLGDAAHPMYPNGSNGASQAILDARTLAFYLTTATSVEAGLDAYEQARRPATTALLSATRQTGPERVMLLARERAPQGFDDIDEVIPTEELVAIAADYKRAAQFDPDALNSRASLNAKVRS